MELSELVHTLPVPAYLCDAEGHIIAQNAAALRLWGRSPKLGQELWCGSWRIYQPDGNPVPLDECPMAVAIHEGKPSRGTRLIIERPDGTRSQVTANPEPIRDEHGAVIGALNLLLEIDSSVFVPLPVTPRDKGNLFLHAAGKDREKGDASPESTLDLLNRALTSAHTGIWEWDIQTSTVSWSPQCFVIWGVEPFKGDLADFTKRIHPEDLDRVTLAASQAIEQRSHYTAEFRIIRPDGKTRWLINFGQPSYDEKGTALRMIGTVQDITEQKEAEDELRRAHTEIHHLSQRMLEVQETERGQLARELREEVITSLQAAQRDLAEIAAAVPSSRERLARSQGRMESLMAQIQRMEADLRPATLGGLAPSRQVLGSLTPRQREILQLVAEGMSTKEIAFLLKRSIKTVESHRMQIMQRLEIREVAGLVRFAIRSGLVSPDR